MKSVILYYSFTGSSKKLAEKMSKELEVEMFEVKTLKKFGILSAYTKGCYLSLKNACVPIEEINLDFEKYDKVIIICPVWANRPAPAFNSLLEIIPKGKELDLHLVSESGKSSNEKNIKFIESKEFKISSYKDIKRKNI